MISRTRLGSVVLGLGLALAAAGTASAQSGPPPTGESLSRADLQGRALSLRIKCESDTMVALHSKLAAPRRVPIACRDGRGRATLQLTAREAGRAAGTDGLTVELSVGRAEPRTLQITRPSKRRGEKPQAKRLPGGYFDLVYASCTAMSGIRNLDINTNGTLFGDRPAPVGYNWGYNPGSVVWISAGAYVYNPATRVYSCFFAPYRQTVVGTRDGVSISVGPNTWVKPLLDVYGGARNWVRTTYVLGATSYGGNDWCYFA